MLGNILVAKMAYFAEPFTGCIRAAIVGKIIIIAMLFAYFCNTVLDCFCLIKRHRENQHLKKNFKDTIFSCQKQNQQNTAIFNFVAFEITDQTNTSTNKLDIHCFQKLFAQADENRKRLLNNMAQ